MNVLIVEDEPLNYDWLQNLLVTNFDHLSCLPQAEDLKQAIKLINQYNPELIFLDIKLGQDDGFELFELLKEPYPIIIFTTAHDQYVIDAIRKGAHDYLLKPIRLKELQNAINRIEFSNQEEKTEDTIVFKTQGESHFLKVDEIIYVKAERSYATVITGSEELLLSQPLKEISNKIPKFFRSHRSFIINPKHIRKYISTGSSNFIEMSNGEKVPLSDSYIKTFKAQFGA